jgi:phage shock protein A
MALADSAQPSLAEEIAALESSDKVEKELEALKASMKGEAKKEG